MRIASLVVRSRLGTGAVVKKQLLALGDIELVEEQGDDFAIVLQARSVSAQKAKHIQIQNLPQVQEAKLVFQSSEV